MYSGNRCFQGIRLTDQKQENLSETAFQRGFTLLCPFYFGLLERKTRLELALKIQISHSFSASCSNNPHQTNKRLRYQSQIYKKSKTSPKIKKIYMSFLKIRQILLF